MKSTQNNIQNNLICSTAKDWNKLLYTRALKRIIGT